MPVRKTTLRRFVANPIGLNKKKFLKAVAKEAEDEARLAVNTGGRHGNIRRDGQRASVVGEPPYTESGTLAASIGSTDDAVFATAAHGAFHEENNRQFLAVGVERALQKTGWLRRIVSGVRVVDVDIL